MSCLCPTVCTWLKQMAGCVRSRAICYKILCHHLSPSGCAGPTTIVTTVRTADMVAATYTQLAQSATSPHQPLRTFTMLIVCSILTCKNYCALPPQEQKSTTVHVLPQEGANSGQKQLTATSQGRRYQGTVLCITTATQAQG